MKAASIPLFFLLATVSILPAQTPPVAPAEEPAPAAAPAPAEPMVATNAAESVLTTNAPDSEPAPAETAAPAPAPVVVPAPVPAPPPPQPQVSPTDAAVQEALRREAARVTLHQKLSAARAAEQRHEINTAVTLYGDAWDLVEYIGSGVDAEARQALSAIVELRMDLARTAQKHGDYKEADSQISYLLHVDPKNVAALEFKRGNDVLIQQQRGIVPSPEAVAMVPAIREDKISAATLVQDGRMLFELGKLDEAQLKLREALKIDPGNTAAIYYSSLVEQERHKQLSNKRDVMAEGRMVEIDREWTSG